MKVFVWKNYGNVEVHACETREQVEVLLDSVYEVALQNLYDEDVEQAELLYEKFADVKPYWLIYKLIDMVGDDADMFQHGTGLTDLKGYINAE